MATSPLAITKYGDEGRIWFFLGNATLVPDFWVSVFTRTKNRFQVRNIKNYP